MYSIDMKRLMSTKGGAPLWVFSKDYTTRVFYTKVDGKKVEVGEVDRNKCYNIKIIQKMQKRARRLGA